MSIAFKTIFAKDFASYFRSGNAYIILGIYALLSFVSAFYVGGYFTLDNTALASFFSHQPEILILLMPAVTMRSWTSEYRQGTIEYLLTQPIGYPTLILAKFSAASLFGVLMLATSLPFWLWTSFLTPLDNLNIFSAYLVCILMICTFSALGCAVSAFNRHGIIAYIITIVVLWGVSFFNLDFLVAPAQNFSADISVRIVRMLNFSKHYQDFVNGQVGFDNFIYFVSVIVSALWFNLVALDYKKE